MVANRWTGQRFILRRQFLCRSRAQEGCKAWHAWAGSPTEESGAGSERWPASPQTAIPRAHDATSTNSEEKSQECCGFLSPFPFSNPQRDICPLMGGDSVMSDRRAMEAINKRPSVDKSLTGPTHS